MRFLIRIYEFILRFGCLVLSLFYWFFVTNSISVPNIIFSCLAISQILSVFVPIGSNNHLYNQSDNIIKSLSIYSIVCIFLIAILLLLVKVNLVGYILFTIFLTALYTFERLAQVLSLKYNKISRFYSYIFLGRFSAYGIVYFLNFQNLLLLFAITELVARLFLISIFNFKSLRVSISSKVFSFKSSFSAIMVAASNWLPMAWLPANVTTEQILASRIILFIFGFTSLFHNQEIAYKKIRQSGFGFVNDKSHFLIITSAIILFSLLEWAGPEILTPYIPSFTANFFLIMDKYWLLFFLSLVFWYVSWANTLVMVKHDVHKEIQVASLCLTFSVLIIFTDLNLPLKIFLILSVWYLLVLLFYGLLEGDDN